MKLTFLLALLGASLPAATVSWPQFRGPNCSGIAESDKPPVLFGPDTNLLWKTALPHGLSSPCIWGDRIFLTSFADGKLETLCLQRQDGRILWRRPAPAENIEEFNPSSSPASATPATDGERVYVYFGSCGLLAYDFEGREQWRRPLPVVVSLNGSGTSPALMDGLIVVNRDQEEGKSSLLALEARTGRTVWETPRPGFFSSYTTPILWRRGDNRDVVVAGSLRAVGYDLKDGKERWSVIGLEAISVCPTPVLGDGQLFAMSRSFGGMTPPSFADTIKDTDKNGDRKLSPDEAKGPFGSKQVFNSIDENKDGLITETEWDASMSIIAKGEHGVFALRAPGTGDLTATHVAWKNKRGSATVPSPLYYRGRLYLVQDGGRVTVYRAATGEVLQEQERLGVSGQYWASPIAADGKIYFTSALGTITVLEAGDSFNVLAKNVIKERINPTPAIADDKLYVRTAKHLWAFGAK